MRYCFWNNKSFMTRYKQKSKRFGVFFGHLGKPSSAENQSAFETEGEYCVLIGRKYLIT